MEEPQEESMNAKRPKKLDLNAPLLSTRRLMCHKDLQGDSQSITADRIPFSWELVPGRPKEMQRNDDTHDENPIPPKPPPSQWFPSEDITDRDKDNPSEYNNEDDGFDADMDDNDEFSDAMDMFSLSEAIDFVERKAEKGSGQGHGLDGWNSKLAELDGYDQSPNFMIQRFLPAANALAASSVMDISKNLKRNLPNYACNAYPDEDYVSKPVASSSGCGLENLFSWGIKHKTCSIKSPVCKGSSVNFKPQQLTFGKTRRKSTSAPAESRGKRESFSS